VSVAGAKVREDLFLLRCFTKSMELTSRSISFSEAGVCGAGHIWHEDLGVEWSWISWSEVEQS